jgi:predicted AAA+ superfamily ATPase
MIKRKLIDKILPLFFKEKVIIIYGARQVGKTTLLRQLEEKLKEKILWLNGDEPDIREAFSNATSTQLKLIIGNHKIVFIDEAQRIKNIGLALKLIIDNFPEIQIVATGSSSFELSDEIKEPLTGRKFEFHLYPLAMEELINEIGYIETKRHFNFILKYGLYPEIITKPDMAKEVLITLSDSYLYKDILMHEGIKKPFFLTKILQALALQIGNEVSFTEIGQLIGIDKNTVEKYINLLEKTFVIFRLNAMSRNLRNEIKKGKKFYFWDIGIRNALISNFNEPDLRPDIGNLWENFVIAERIKHLKNNSIYGNCYFWRSTAQKEVDLIEEIDGKLKAYEIKWNKRKKAKLPLSFSKNYNLTEFQIINNENFWERIS